MHGSMGFTINLHSLVRAQVMPYDAQNDLHGNVPDQSDVCLLSIDTSEDNRIAFDQMNRMLKAARRSSDQLTWNEKIQPSRTQSA